MYRYLADHRPIIAGIIILGLIGLFVTHVQAQANPRLWLELSNANPAAVGDTAVVTMTASDIAGFNAIDTRLVYDAAVVEVVPDGAAAVAAGDCIPPGSFYVSNDVDLAGQINYIGTMLGGTAPAYCSNGAGADTTIGAVTFRCLVDDGSSTVVSYDTPTLALVGSDVTPSTIQSATITCGSACTDLSTVHIPVDIAESGSDVVLSWTAVVGANAYEVWRSDSPYFTPGSDCSTDPTCTVEAAPTHTHVGAIGSPLTNHYYKIVAVNSCDGTSAGSTHTAEFDFAIQPGS